MPSASSFPEPAAADKSWFGGLAAQLVNNDAVLVAFRTAETDISRLWGMSALDERDKREELYHELLALKRVWRTLEGMGREAKNANLKAERLKAVV